MVKTKEPLVDLQLVVPRTHISIDRTRRDSDFDRRVPLIRFERRVGCDPVRVEQDEDA